MLFKSHFSIKLLSKFIDLKTDDVLHFTLNQIQGYVNQTYLQNMFITASYSEKIF